MQHIDRIIYSIYLITNIITGKQYIGFTSQTPERRWYMHKYTAKTRSKGYTKCHLHNSIEKYGSESFIFSVIYQSLDKLHTLNEMEKHFIEMYNTKDPYGYNLTSGGEGNSGWTLPKETRSKIGKSLRNHFNNNPMSAELKKKLSDGQIERHKKYSASIETRQKISNIHKGKIVSEETRQKIRSARLGTHMSPEAIENMRRSAKLRNKPKEL